MRFSSSPDLPFLLVAAELREPPAQTPAAVLKDSKCNGALLCKSVLQDQKHA